MLGTVKDRLFRNPVDNFISRKVFIKLFCKSKFPRKSVNSFFILVMIKDKLTELCEN